MLYQFVEGSRVVFQCIAQNRPDASEDLVVHWFNSNRITNTSTTIIYTTEEDSNRIVTSTLVFDPLNHTDGFDKTSYVANIYCTSFIGSFFSDRVDSGVLMLEVLCESMKYMLCCV